MKATVIIFQFLLEGACFGQNIPLPVIKVNQSQCEQLHDHLRLQNRIVNQTLAYDTIITTLGIWANCSGISEVKAFANGDTLKLYYIEGKNTYDTAKNGFRTITHSSSMCKCCFEFSFTTLGLKNKPMVTLVNDSSFKYFPDKHKIFPITFNMAGIDTVNFVDKYGRKQGKWLNPKYTREYDNNDSIYFVGNYNNDWLKTCEYRIYNKSGKLAFVKVQTDYDSYTETDYFEDGNIKEQYNQNGNKERMHYEYYPNGILKYVHIDNDSFYEVTIYYKNGKLKEINNNLICREFYENGQLKKETLYLKNHDHIWAKYYYENGRLMAIEYKKDKTRKGKTSAKHWYKCYDKNGSRVPRDVLVSKGYLMLKG